MFCKDKKMPSFVSFLKEWKSHSKNKNNSFVTILALWSSMLGSASLVLPWAVTKTGLEISLISLLLFMAMCGYTAYLIVWLQKKMPDAQTTKPDFNVICHKYLDNVGSNVSFILSMTSFILPGILLYILTVYNLFYVVDFTRELSTNQFEMLPITTNVIICDKNFNFISNLSLDSNKRTSEDLYPLIWNTHLTVPLFCLLIYFPILAIKTPAFFIKFSAFGILPIVYLLFFITFKSAIWGFNSDYFSNFFSFRHFNTSFSTLGGILFLAFFIHNGVIPIFENQKNPCNNSRDLIISYVLATMTLGYIGLVYTFFFPGPKDCIADNLLNNFASTDILAFTARVFLIIQMLTNSPLIIYALRFEFFSKFFNSKQPSSLQIIALNSVLLIVFVLFAIFYPRIGNIARYLGSVCGLGYIIILPLLVKIFHMKSMGELKVGTIIIYISIILVAISTFVAQFFAR